MRYDVLPGPGAVRRYPQRRLGIVCQTTSTTRNVEAVRRAVAESNPGAEIRFVDTVCHPTKDHQRALERLLEQAEAVVVVGGRNSNNTRELVARCHQRRKPVRHVQSARDLDLDSFKAFAVVGLTAGTSTLPATIVEVHRALVGISFGKRS